MPSYLSSRVPAWLAVQPVLGWSGGRAAYRRFIRDGYGERGTGGSVRPLTTSRLPPPDRADDLEAHERTCGAAHGPVDAYGGSPAAPTGVATC